MNDLQRAFYRDRIENHYLKLNGEAFQDFFASLMERRYPAGDFIRTRPWGNLGDRKNDGYLRSKRTLFQVYAPDELTSKEAEKKIREDFHGALPHWKQYFDSWVFVHNAHKGLGPDIVKVLLELEKASQGQCQLLHWGLSDFVREALVLSVTDLQDLFGAIPSQRDILNLGVAEIQPLLDQLEKLIPQTLDLRPVPPDKLQFNLLSEGVKLLIAVGERKSGLVFKCYQHGLNPTLRDQHAEGFRAKYQALRVSGLEPDRLFRELEVYVGGEAQPSPMRQVAVLAVMAHFFEACDIFERPEELP